MQTFDEINLNKQINKALIELGFIKPTPIQAKTIPLLMDSSRDLIGSAQTGTGKTAAFSIPLLTKVMNNADVYGLIVTPTRELAMQVDAQIRMLLSLKSKIRSVVLIGGASMDRQMQMLSKNPRIIVGTPGRIIDHLDRNSVDLSTPHLVFV